jgi:hypothetical protein
VKSRATASARHRFARLIRDDARAISRMTFLACNATMIAATGDQ